MKKAIKILAFLAVTVVLLSLPCGVLAASVKYPEPTERFFVNDYADIITDTDEETMYDQGVQLYNASKAQVVVVAVDSIGSSDIASYSIGLARKWGIGDKEKNNGVLILLAVSEREVKIEVGRGLEGALPDSKVGRILDLYGVDYFKENRFSEGLASVYDSVVNEIYIEYGLEPDRNYTPVPDDTMSTTEVIIMIIVIAVFITVFIILNIRYPSLSRSVRGGVFYGGMMGSGRTYGGGFHGGGGGFHGGGGGFSGGGASRKF